MKKQIIVFAFGAMMVCSACGNQNSKDSVKEAMDKNESTAAPGISEADRNYAVKAASGGMMEVELGQMAAAQASSQLVKDFGQSMAGDHSAANEELKGLAAQKQITLPDVPGKDHQDKIDKLRKKTGKEFDKAYMEMMVDDHKEDIALFENEANNGNDPDLKSWAAAKLETLRHHLHMAEQTKEMIKD